MDISISEVTAFLRCRRMWDYSSSNRQALRKIGIPKATLNVGTLMHAALAGAAQGLDPYAVLMETAEAQKEKFIAQHTEATGFSPAPETLQELLDQSRQVLQLLQRYEERYGFAKPLGERYAIHGTESTFRVPIPNTEDGFLIGTIDRYIAEAGTTRWYVGEIKTYHRRPDISALVLRPQFTAYVWAASILFGTEFKGVLYDGIRQELPKSPEPLKNGRISQAKTTVEASDFPTYRDAIRNAGLNEMDYITELDYLKARDSQRVTPFFAQQLIPITHAQLANFERELPLIYEEMVNVQHIIPSFQSTCTWDCNYTDLCTGTQLGEDVDFLLKHAYTHNEGSQSNQNAFGEEVEADERIFS